MEEERRLLMLTAEPRVPDEVGAIPKDSRYCERIVGGISANERPPAAPEVFRLLTGNSPTCLNVIWVPPDPAARSGMDASSRCPHAKRCGNARRTVHLFQSEPEFA